MKEDEKYQISSVKIPENINAINAENDNDEINLEDNEE